MHWILLFILMYAYNFRGDLELIVIHFKKLALLIRSEAFLF